MIQLVFEDALSTKPVTLGPAPWFRVSGNFMRVGPHGTIAGTYRQHQWEVEACYFTRWDCHDRCLIHFEDAAGGATEDFGAFDQVYAADGVVHVDDKLFAKFVEESQLWHCYPTENFWPVLIIKTAVPRVGG